ncbi:hypothetical protein [Bacillus sp. S14(2024)]|uniref:hypothetical protein n=1 Tax=Bacillus sp. S14(2024) TaxID=3162884 RepID=UPI003D1A1043
MEENTTNSPYINTDEGVYTSAKLQQAMDQAFRIPVFLSTVNTLNQLQQQFLDRLVLEVDSKKECFILLYGSSRIGF